MDRLGSLLQRVLPVIGLLWVGLPVPAADHSPPPEVPSRGTSFSFSTPGVRTSRAGGSVVLRLAEVPRRAGVRLDGSGTAQRRDPDVLLPDGSIMLRVLSEKMERPGKSREPSSDRAATQQRLGQDTPDDARGTGESRLQVIVGPVPSTPEPIEPGSEDSPPADRADPLTEHTVRSDRKPTLDDLPDDLPDEATEAPPVGQPTVLPSRRTVEPPPAQPDESPAEMPVQRPARPAAESPGPSPEGTTLQPDPQQVQQSLIRALMHPPASPALQPRAPQVQVLAPRVQPRVPQTPRHVPRMQPPAPRVQPPAAPPSRPRTLQQPVGSLLRPPMPTRQRSARLEQIAQQADKRVRRGFELAGREASFAARSEFIMALRLIAQGLDAEYGTLIHSRALAVALTAIKEADDFIPPGTKLEADLDLPSLISGHRTPVLKDTDATRLTPMLALSTYFTFAQEQLSVAAGREVAGSMALHALGKLHSALARQNAARQNAARVRSAEPKAIAFFQAALLVIPQNYLAANDLGVLLARCGNYPHARNMLERSLALNQQPTGWHNLAVVYQQQGQLGLARRAQQQSIAVQRSQPGRSVPVRRPGGTVLWLSPAAFAQMRGGGNALSATPVRRPVPQARVQPPAPARRPQPASQPVSNKPWSPWNWIQKPF